MVVDVVSDDGTAMVTESHDVAPQLVEGFFQYLASKYPVQARSVSYRLGAPRSIELTYPKGISASDRERALDAIGTALDSYVLSLQQKPQAEVPTPGEQQEVPVVGTIKQQSITATVTSYDGHATVDYPSWIPQSDLSGFLAFVADSYPADTLDIKYTVPDAGTLDLTYPTSIPKDVRAQAIVIAQQLLGDYLASLSAVVEPVSEEPIVRTIGEGSITADVTSIDGSATVLYSPALSEAQVVDFMHAVVQAYPQQTKSVTYDFPSSGVVHVSYPLGMSRDERNGAIDAVDALLRSYITPEPEVVEVEETVLPPEPFMFEPAVYTQEDYDMFFKGVEPAPQDANDPFADFFVSGESDMAYDDGWYYMSLYINEEYSGDIEVQLSGDEQALNAVELQLILNPMVTDVMYQS